MNRLLTPLAIALGGSLGALARHFINLASFRLLGRAFPYGTLFINLTGSFALGYFLARVARGWHVPQPLQFAVTVGFLGAYTTFSTFMFESDTFLRTGLLLRATLYLFLSLALGLAAVRLGVIAGQRF
jgi:CrcB protein